MKTMTHKAKIKDLTNSSLAIILKELEWTQEEYSTRIFNNGCLFVENWIEAHYTGIEKTKFDELVNQIVFNEKYWNWWRNEWNQCDMQYCADLNAANSNKEDVDLTITTRWTLKNVPKLVYIERHNDRFSANPIFNSFNHFYEYQIA